MSPTTLEKTRPGLFIDGEARAGAGKVLPVIDPATGEAFAELIGASHADVDHAVASARKAFEGPWAKAMAARRTRVLFKVGELVRQRTDLLAELESRNTGKPISSAKGEMAHVAEVFEYFAGACARLSGHTPPTLGGHLAYTLREPLGVVAAIIPWNYPLVIAAWKLAPALAGGNAVVLKPAEQTPVTAMELARILVEAGVPAGTVNVVNGTGEEVGAYLAAHPSVDKVAFTGSTEVGKRIMAACAQDLRRVSLELGGKSPNLVFDDSDLEGAVDGALYGIYGNTGQACNARSRLLLQAGIADAFLARFLEKAGKLRVGDPMDPKTQVGPLISEEQWQRVHGYVEAGRKEGAKVVLGGDRPAHTPSGHFYAPTVLDEVQGAMRVAREEIFGPVVAVTRFKDEAEAVKVANDSPYGLYAAIWTKDLARAHRVARALQAGGISINTPVGGGDLLGLPFGGYKQSGFGRELSDEALNDYTQTKAILVNTTDKIFNLFGA